MENYSAVRNNVTVIYVLTRKDVNDIMLHQKSMRRYNHGAPFKIILFMIYTYTEKKPRWFTYISCDYF